MNNNSKAINNIKNSFNNSSIFVKTILIIIIIIVVLSFILWIIFKMKDKSEYDQYNPIIISGIMNTDTNIGPLKNLPKPVEGTSISYSFWFNITEYKSSKEDSNPKWIILRSDITNEKLNNISDAKSFKHTPSIYLDGNKNDLKSFTSYYNNNESVIQECNIKNIPINKWNHVVYVLNNNTIELYLNSKLESSCVISGIPLNGSGDLQICPDGNTFDGKIAQMQYFTYALKPDKIIELYNSGYSGAGKVVFNTSDNKYIDYSKLKDELCDANINYDNIKKIIGL